MTWNLGDELHSQDVAHKKQLSFEFYKDEYTKDIDWKDAIQRTDETLCLAAKVMHCLLCRNYHDAVMMLGCLMDVAANDYAKDLFNLPKRGEE